MKHRPSIHANAVESLEPRLVLSGVELLADLNSLSIGSWVSDLTEVGPISFFQANDGFHGNALWRTDGTPSGTVLVKDLRSDRTDPELYALTAVGDRLFFVATDQVLGHELWTSDGTEEGTVPLWHHDMPTYWKGPLNLVAAQGLLYFLSWDTDEGGYELWKSDGTMQGTVHVKDILPLPNRGRPRLFGEVNGRLLFKTEDGTHGHELWSSDGTEFGTRLIADTTPAEGSTFADNSDSMYLTANGKLLFVADANPNELSLWVSDGTEAGTTPLAAIPGQPHSLTQFDGVAVFFAYDDVHAWQLWRTDGTAAGTGPIFDWPAPFGFGPTNLSVAGDAAYFRVDDGIHGEELWRTDGTREGTRLHADLNPGPESSRPDEFVVVNDTLFFTTKNSGQEKDLWRVDPHTTTVSLVFDATAEDRPTYVRPIGEVNGRLFTNVTTPGIGGREAFTDGTPEGAAYFNLNTTTGSSEVFWRASLGDSIFGTQGGISPIEVYRLDRNSHELQLIHKFERTYYGTELIYADIVNGAFTLLLRTWKDLAIWTYDPVNDDLRLVVEIIAPNVPTQKCMEIGKNTRDRESLLFATEGATGCDLWRTDGTSAGTSLLIASSSIANPDYVGDLFALDGRIFLPVRSQHHLDGLEWWTSDGTPNGTQSFERFLGIGLPIRVRMRPARLDDSWLFVASDAADGDELWVSDGTREGTRQLVDIFPGPDGSRISGSGAGFIRIEGELLFFFADDGLHGKELWRTDGTEVGTFMVRDFGVGNNDSPALDILGELDGDLLLSASPGFGKRRQLFRTNGSDEGTVQLSSIRSPSPGVPLPRVADPNSLMVVNGIAFFFGSEDGTSNDQLWISDGTPGGTRLFHDFDILDAPCRDYTIHKCLREIYPGIAMKGEVVLRGFARRYGWEPFIIRRDPGDTNFDSIVDIKDLNTVRGNFGRAGANLPGDLTQDGRVDVSDLNEVRNHFQVPTDGNTTTATRHAASSHIDKLQHRSLKARTQITDVIFRLAGESAAETFSVQARRATSRSSSLLPLRVR